MYTIAIDAERDLVQVVLAGLLTVEEVDAYMCDLRHAMFKDGVASNYGIVIDTSACTIQTQDMIQAMGVRMAAMPKARAIAIVSLSALARMQIRRLFQQDYARVVASPDDGRAWVVDGEEPPVELPVAAQRVGP